MPIQQNSTPVTVLPQTSKVSDGVTANFTVQADLAVQQAYAAWQAGKGNPPYLMFSFTSPDAQQNPDGQYVIWLQRCEKNVWVGNGVLVGYTDSTGIDASGSAGILVDWNGQQLVGRMTVATSYACTINSMKYQVIYPT